MQGNNTKLKNIASVIKPTSIRELVSIWIALMPGSISSTTQVLIISESPSQLHTTAYHG